MAGDLERDLLFFGDLERGDLDLFLFGDLDDDLKCFLDRTTGDFDRERLLLTGDTGDCDLDCLLATGEMDTVFLGEILLPLLGGESSRRYLSEKYI